MAATMYEVPVERGKIREFARAAKSENPAYYAEDAVVPPTFLTTALLFWGPDWRNQVEILGFDFSRILHGSESYTFHGPIPRAGQTLHVTSRAEAKHEKQGRRGGVLRFGALVNEFRDDSGVLRVEQRTTFIETSQAVQRDC